MEDASPYSLRGPARTPIIADSSMTVEASPSTKGLRNMSVKICEKVQEKGTITCTKVADELIKVIKKEQEYEGRHDKNCDEKNVRRRVYDALNVLEAVDVISKNSKDISWNGMPNHRQNELRRLKEEQHNRNKQIKAKHDELRERLVQHIAYRNLIRYNERRSHSYNTRLAQKLSMPFVLFNSHPNAEVHCDATRDMTHLRMDVNAPFALHDENSVLKQMGFDRCTEAELREMIPADLYNYCEEHGLLDGIVTKKRGRGGMAPVQDPRKRVSKRKYGRSHSPQAKRMRKATRC